ncbi:MAG TPA: alpha/beta hydrolase [Gemmatimonadaceae bacterium]|nr:alpha/beta hydrolase [Gemmatimonadaceae bacterium]
MDADLLRIPVGPGSMHVERYGHGGAPILLVHGFGTCSFLWREIGPVLATASRTAFSVDLFGYGESDRPFDAQFGIAAQSDYLDRALTALRLSRATVVGIDLGAAVAMHLAYNRPERVERLVLINPIAFDDVPAEDIKTMQRNTARFAFRISRGTLGAAPLMRELLEKSVANPEHMPDPLLARYLAPYVGQDGVNHLLALGRAVDEDDMADVDLTQLDCPTLIVWGDQDPFVTPKLGDRLADTIPGSRLVRLPGTGRLVPEEAPDTLTNMILEFVGAAGMVARTE